MHCFECAAAMPDNMIYCLNCGAKLNGEAETVVRERMAPPSAQPRIIIMPPIPSRTEIAITFIKENLRTLSIGFFGTLFISLVIGIAIYYLYFSPVEQTF